MRDSSVSYASAVGKIDAWTLLLQKLILSGEANYVDFSQNDSVI